MKENIRAQQAAFARTQMRSEDEQAERQRQSEEARAEIKIKVIANGLLVKGGDGWFSFKDLDDALPHIRARIKAAGGAA